MGDADDVDVDDTEDDIPMVHLDKMIPQNVVVDSSPKTQYKPSKLEKVSFLELDLHDSTREKVTENSLSVAPEVENAKKLLVGKENFPSFHDLKEKMSNGLHNIKVALKKTKNKLSNAITNEKFGKAGNYMNSKVGGNIESNFNKKLSKKNSAFSLSLFNNYFVIFFMSLVFVW